MIVSGVWVGSLVVLLVLAVGPANAQQAGAPDLSRERSGSLNIEVTLVARGLRGPSSIAVLPDGRALIADRPLAALFQLDLGTGSLDTLSGLPPIATAGDGGFHDVILDPQFATNRRVYVSYSVMGPGETYALAVARARLEGTRLINLERLFTAAPFLEGGDHFGGRMAIAGEFLFVTSGDRQHPALAQSLTNHIGKILRLRLDGSAPPNNPFVDRTNARAEIWSYGHRNPQGLAFHPQTGELWAHEHGPRGGDEINLIRRGANYGWPITSYGFEYDGGPIGAGIPQRDGIESPVHVYVPSIAPSGLLFYSGAAFPDWQGSLLIGALALRHLNRIELERNTLRVEERLLGGRGFRVRALAQALDGSVLLGIDGGMVLRLSAH